MNVIKCKIPDSSIAVWEDESILILNFTENAGCQMKARK